MNEFAEKNAISLVEARDQVNATLAAIDKASTPLEMNNLLLEHLHAVTNLIQGFNRLTARR